MSSHPHEQNPAQGRSWLDVVEKLGNRIPEPALLFSLLALAVVVIAGIGDAAGWSVQPVKPVLVEAGAEGGGRLVLEATGAPLTVRPIADAEGLYWFLSSMLRNFASMPALPLIFVAMLGIGLAERFGFFSALMRGLALVTPAGWLTPVIIFIGTNSSVASDAGYIILPPLAAALFAAAGRHPVAGLAAAFAGVSGGFGAGFFPTGGDGVLAGFAQDAAHVVQPSYGVTIVHNLYFKMASSVVVTLAGWWLTDRVVEPRLRRLFPVEVKADADLPTASSMELNRGEVKALLCSLGLMGGLLALCVALVLVPGSPLHGNGQPLLPNGRALVSQAVKVSPEAQAPAAEAVSTASAAAQSGQPAASSVDASRVLTRSPLEVVATSLPGRLVEPPGPRWSQAIVPIILATFLFPGMLYGWMTGRLRSQHELIQGLQHGIASIVPVLVTLFFLAQFVNLFAYTHLARMLAFAGGSLLFDANLPIPLLLVLFILVVILGDFAMSGMLSKFGVLAPIFIPMFMMVGISPELTTAAYRIGDSVVNVVTPLNSYVIIILAVYQKYRAGAGIGNLMTLMLPYSLAFGVVWAGLLLLWYGLGVPLGPGSSLSFP